MDQEKKNAIALMRYSVIAPLITGLADDYDSLTAFFNNASVKGVIHPDGSISIMLQVLLNVGMQLTKRMASMLLYLLAEPTKVFQENSMKTSRNRLNI